MSEAGDERFVALFCQGIFPGRTGLSSVMYAARERTDRTFRIISASKRFGTSSRNLRGFMRPGGETVERERIELKRRRYNNGDAEFILEPLSE